MENGTSHIHIDGNWNRRRDIHRRRVIDNLWEWVGRRFVEARADEQPGARSQGENSDDQDDYLMLRQFFHCSGDPLVVERAASRLLRRRRMISAPSGSLP